MKKAGRKPVDKSLVRAERITELMERENLRQSDLAAAIGSTQQNISRVLSSQRISESFIQRIIEAFPDYREEWLFGYDKVPTHSEKQIAKSRAYSLNAPIKVLDDALLEVCAREKMEVPHLDNIPELLLLEAQLKDFAVSLMWQYIKYRENSSVWSYLDHVEHLKSEE